MNQLESKTIDSVRRDLLQKILMLNMPEQRAYNLFQQYILDVMRVF
jgi:hypothetical protein